MCRIAGGTRGGSVFGDGLLPRGKLVNSSCERPLVRGSPQDSDGIFDKSFYQLNDAQRSIVSVVSVGTIQVDATHSWSGHQTVDWLEYDPYGRSRRWAKADYNMNGSLDAGDTTSLIGGYTAGDKSADADESGTVNVSDIFAHLADWFTGDTTPQDALSHTLIDNPYGYCGYYADAETRGIRSRVSVTVTAPTSRALEHKPGTPPPCRSGLHVHPPVNTKAKR